MSTKVTSSLKKPLTTYLEEQQPIGTLNNGSVNTSASSGGLSTSGSVPQPTIALSPESVSSAQNSTNVQAPTYVSALETTVNPNTVANNNVTSLPNVNAGAMTNVTYKDAVKEPEIVTADGNTETPTESDGSVVTGDGSTGIITDSGEDTSSSGEGSSSEVKAEAPKLSYTEWLDLQKTNIAQAYEDAKKAAETQRQRAIHNAGGTYQQALTQYGANAEAMSAMGLTGSGYSKYLDSQALAQKQGAINAANSDYQSALSSADATKRSAENEVAGLYAQYLENEEAKKEAKVENEEAIRRNAYNAILENIGKYSTNDIARLGKANGLSGTQIEELQAARNEYTPSTEDTGVDPYKVFNELYNNIEYYTANDIDRLTRNAGLASDSQYVNDLKEKRAEVMRALLDQGYYSKADLDELLELGEFGEDKTTNNKLYQKYLGELTDSDNIDTSVETLYATDEDGKFITNEDGSKKLKPYSEAKSALDFLIAENEKLKKDENDVGPYKAAIDEFEKTIKHYYTAQIPDETITFKRDNFGGNTGDDGNEIKVTYGDENYTLTYNGNSGNISDLANGLDIADNTVFMYQGVLCIRHGNKYYQLKAGKYKTNSYNTIKNAFN